MKKSRATLLIAPSPPDAWECAMRNWFDAVSSRAWKETRPSLVVVPTRNHAQALKARLLREKRSHLGLRFVTPFVLREMLAPHAVPLRAHLRLLLAISAETQTSADSDALAAKAVVRTPEHLLRALDRLTSTGWNLDSLPLQSFAPIIRDFRAQLAACGFQLSGEIDPRLTRPDELQFGSVLITGFDSSHWPDWFLLRAAVASAEDATVLLDYPHGNISDADELWIGSWEEALGEARPLKTAAQTDSLFTETEMRGATRRITYLVGANASEEAEAVSLTCARFLADAPGAQIGIIFARTGALPRLVSAALTRRETPHNDGLAHLVPGLFESSEWRAWLELQRSPRVAAFLHFFKCLTSRAEIFPALSEATLERVLRDARAQVLIDNLDVLREFCLAEHPLVADAIHSLDRVPDCATLAEFLQVTETACARFHWPQHWIEISNRIGDWTGKVATKFSRALYLRWLEEIATTFGIERSETGNHPYARVQLLTVAPACGQEWSHLIFAGWNEGAWPPPIAGEFAREEDIAEFNRSVRQLNTRATKRGRHGEGHVSIREGHTFYLGPVEQRQIALRQFEALRQSATEEIALSASLVQESEPERLWNPSELFTQLYQETEHRPLTQTAMRRLQEATHRWLEASDGLTSTRSSAAITQTRVAYDARRDPNAKSGEYDFAFRAQEPNRVPIFAVSEFEKFISAPALVWLKGYLGIKAPEDDALIWNTSSGKWIHDWLAAVSDGKEKTFARFPVAAEIDQRVLSAAQELRASIEELCRRAKKKLPDWWRSGWQNALFLARSLGEKLATADDWPCLATEWKIDDLPVVVTDNATITFRGRIDLILAREQLAADSLRAEELWIVDYKTGAKRALKAPAKKRLLDGTAMQLGLYSLAAHALGAKQVFISILSPLVRPLTPQLSESDIRMESEIFSELARMQQTGTFGMHGQLRSFFRLTEDYPLATLAIDPDILEQRWEQTHPALVREEEDIFW